MLTFGESWVGKNIIYDPEAKLEIKEATEFYEGCRDELGQSFLKELESAIDDLTENPFAWRRT